MNSILNITRASTLASLSLFLAVSGSFAQSSPVERPGAKEKQHLISQQTASIRTRADLVKYLQKKDDSNPLNKLSEEAKEKLLKTLVINKYGEISSYYIADIKSELSPSEAYRVLALFGDQRLAARVNNGIMGSNLDAMIIDSDAQIAAGVPSPQAGGDGYYCNGGYCTQNSQFICKVNSCNPR